jgi:hypothetical protein
MTSFNRVALLFMFVFAGPLLASSIVWSEVGDAGALPKNAQSVTGNNESVDAILGRLNDANNADMFEILITDLLDFSAEVFADPLHPKSKVQPQIFLFDENGFAISGGFGAVGDAILPFGPDPDLYLPGFYFLMVDTVGVDPSYTMTNPKGVLPRKQPAPLFCHDFALNPFAANPCVGAENQAIDGYIGQGLDPSFTGNYEILLTGVTAFTPEPGTMVLLLSGLAAAVALHRRRNARRAD